MLSSAVYLNDNLNNLHQIRKTSCSTPSMLRVQSVFTPKNQIKTVPFYPIMKPPLFGYPPVMGVAALVSRLFSPP